MTDRVRRRTAAAAVLALAITALAALSPLAPVATAHDQVVSTEPSDGAHLDVAPEAVTVRFSADILDIGATILVVDPQGRDWADGEVRREGAAAIQTLAQPLPDGAYQVRWRVVSGDGHPISGALEFSVGTAAPATTSAPTTAASPPATSPAATATPATSGAPATSGSPATTGGALRSVVVGVLGAGAGVGIVAIVTLVRRRFRRP